MSQLLISQKQRDQICVMLKSLKPEFGAVGSRDVEVRMRRDDVDLIISTLAALTQPASPALKLPDGWAAVPIEPTEEMIAAWREDMDKSYAKEHAIKIGEDEIVFAHQAMLAAAPPVPHTVPIEPICATGGAEWMSNERVEEIIYRAEMFGHGAGYLPDEVITMAKELLALRKAFSEPYGWITEYPSIPAGIGGMTYSFHDNRQDAQDEAEAYDGFAVAVIRKP